MVGACLLPKVRESVQKGDITNALTIRKPSAGSHTLLGTRKSQSQNTDSCETRLSWFVCSQNFNFPRPAVYWSLTFRSACLCNVKDVNQSPSYYFSSKMFYLVLEFSGDQTTDKTSCVTSDRCPPKIYSVFHFLSFTAI